MYSFQDLADELKQTRLKKEITLDQVSFRTKIDLKFLEAMESGDFSFLPDIYVKAFVKQYAGALDLDENETLKKYDAARSGASLLNDEIQNNDNVISQPEQSPPTVIKQNNLLYDAVDTGSSNLKSQNNSAKNKTILSGIIAVLVIFGIIYFFFLRSSKEIIVTEKPIEQVIQEDESRYKVNTPAKDSVTTTAANLVNDSLSLVIYATDTSWVKIIADNEDAQDFIMFPRSQKVLNAENNFKITFGNSGAINLKLNNKKLDFNGEKGKIKYVYIDKSGLKYLKLR
jgi:cytoskeletal protein RodZ